MPLILFLIIKIFISFNSPASVLINEDFDSTRWIISEFIKLDVHRKYSDGSK